MVKLPAGVIWKMMGVLIVVGVTVEVDTPARRTPGWVPPPGSTLAPATP